MEHPILTKHSLDRLAYACVRELSSVFDLTITYDKRERRHNAFEKNILWMREQYEHSPLLKEIIGSHSTLGPNGTFGYDEILVQGRVCKAIVEDGENLYNLRRLTLNQAVLDLNGFILFGKTDDPLEEIPRHHDLQVDERIQRPKKKYLPFNPRDKAVLILLDRIKAADAFIGSTCRLYSQMADFYSFEANRRDSSKIPSLSNIL